MPLLPIEYPTGDESAKWGAARVRDGHSKPFTLHFIEIGKEDVLTPKSFH